MPKGKGVTEGDGTLVAADGSTLVVVGGTLLVGVGTLLVDGATFAVFPDGAVSVGEGALAVPGAGTLLVLVVGDGALAERIGTWEMFCLLSTPGPWLLFCDGLLVGASPLSVLCGSLEVELPALENDAPSSC